MLCGTVQLWQWCHLCVIYDECLLIQCMWLMQPLSGAIQYVMDQFQIDLVYWLMGRMLGSLMSDSQWPVGPVIGLQFNRGSKYVAPPIENPIPVPILALCHPCGLLTVLLALEKISKEPTFICDNLDGLLREADEGRARDLQEGSSSLVVRLPPWVCSEAWRRLNRIHWMWPGPGRREQRAMSWHDFFRPLFWTFYPFLSLFLD